MMMMIQLVFAGMNGKKKKPHHKSHRDGIINSNINDKEKKKGRRYFVWIEKKTKIFSIQKKK